MSPRPPPPDHPFLETLDRLCTERLASHRPVIVAVTAPPGSGKSFLGRQLRHHGFGSFPSREIAVIDDGVMTLELFRVLRRKLRVENRGKDELRPFLERLPRRKRVLFFLSADPARRLSFADIWVELRVGTALRRERLLARTGGDRERAERMLARPAFEGGALGFAHHVVAELGGGTA